MNDTLIQPRKPYRIQSAETWGLVRTHYLRGMSARELSERFGVSVSNIRRRAGEEGWTRRGHAEEVGPPPDRRLPPPYRAAREGADAYLSSYPSVQIAAQAEAEGSSPAFAGPPANSADVIELALGAAARCIASGRFVEAERLAKMAETLSRLGGGSGGGGRGSSGYVEPGWDPPAPPKTSPEEMMAMRAEVERRFERLARSFDPKPTPDPLVVAYGLEDAHTCEGDTQTYKEGSA